MEDAEAAIFLHEDVVDEVCSLFSRFNVLCALRNELQNLIGRRKNTQKGRNHRQNGVADLSQDDLRAPIFLVPKRISQIIGHRVLTLGSDIAINVGLRVFDSLSNRITELVLVHWLIQLGNEPSLRIV